VPATGEVELSRPGGHHPNGSLALLALIAFAGLRYAILLGFYAAIATTRTSIYA